MIRGQSSASLPVAGGAKQDSWLQQYLLRGRWMRNGHVQTLAGNYWPRRLELPELTQEVVQVEPGHDGMAASSIQCDCHWQPKAVRAKRLTILLLHGVEGSSDSHYVRGNTVKAWRAGCNVIRMNMRNCGGSNLECPTLYHAGRSEDVRNVIEHCVSRYGLAAVAAIGYSMGGNIVLKYAGELGPDAPDYLKAVVGVSPAIDLAESSDALHQWQNRMYERMFLRGLASRFKRKAQQLPQLYDGACVDGVKSIREFDTAVVARYCGYADAQDYYTQASSKNLVGRISVPTLVIHAIDDPFIRMTSATREKLLANAKIRLIETDHGGHCAFLEPRGSVRMEAATGVPVAGFDGYWAEKTLLEFVLEAAAQPPEETPSTAAVGRIIPASRSASTATGASSSTG